MVRRIAFSLLLVALLAILPQNQVRAGTGLVSPEIARRFGLERAWCTQVALNRSSGRTAHITLHVSTTEFLTIQDVDYPGGRSSYTAKDLDQFGDPVGDKGAERLAQRRLKSLLSEGVKARIVVRKVPKITLYVQVEQGSLYAIDGETGRTRWSRVVGNANYPSLKPGASDQHVAVVNGSTLYVLHASSGDVLWKHRLGNAPGAGPAINKTKVFCPLINGRLEVYEIKHPRKPPWYYQSAGHPTGQPVLSSDTVGWSTDRGTFYAASFDPNKVRYRMQTNDAIRDRPVFASGKRVFITSDDGHIYALDETRGDVLWRFSAGEPISQSPAVNGTSVYAVTNHAGMVCLSIDLGQVRWRAGQARKFVAASKDRVYCLNGNRQLIVLNAKTGGRIGIVPLSDVDQVFSNQNTDRIYLVTRRGMIQCLHTEGQDHPMIHRSGTMSAATREAAAAADLPPVQQIDVEQGKGDDDLLKKTAPKKDDIFDDLDKSKDKKIDDLLGG